MLDLEIRASEGAGTIEDSAGEELTVCEGDGTEPYVGMVFESEDAAKVFYDDYARHVGFIGRIVSSRRSERDGSFILRKLACNKEGFSLSSRKIDRVRIRKRQSQREGCMAMMPVKRQKPGNWVVTKFIKDHNHPMVLNSNKERRTPVRFSNVRDACCGLGRYGGMVGCVAEDLACRDPSQHFWWDFYNPTQGVNALLANWSWNGQPHRLCRPFNIQQLASSSSAEHLNITHP
ncbi:hypothetical protein ACHQM5_019878 [Ranunculus cassubicifolius]